MRILAKAAKLSPSEVREFLQSKTSYTRLTQATRKFESMRACERFKDENWCVDLAYVDKLAKDNNGVKYLLVHQGLFDRTVDAKVMKTKDSKGTVKTFSKMNTKKNKPKKIWVKQGTEFAGEFETFCSPEGMKEFTIQWMRRKQHLKNVYYAHSNRFCIAKWRFMGKATIINYLIYCNIEF